MKESTWFKAYEQEVIEKKNKANGSKKTIFLILAIMMIFFLVCALVNEKSFSAETLIKFLPLLGTFAFIIILVSVLMLVTKKADPAKRTRNNLKELLRSDEEVEAFDLQMSTTPLKEFEVSQGTILFLTQDYIGEKGIDNGNVFYKFIRNKDIAYYDYMKTKSTTANPLKAAYFYDIRKANQEVILNGIADSSTQLEQLEDLLKTAQPSIQKSRK